ncbi:uncharacterized protein FOMMEDRAFT_155211 [Fomitiporia mediterranea MF3/22]|uniref:uncharacterized protein n=1 Tax=Fomitiporia mediterranea (strain MF3/22) TaxID=694068 RepID=UPI0004408E52|nr:uncharacterized protein FOMMEDRAFT_155211 [Fomitiporia mediterranea MF3/22]EJD04077.1 hypothetical protein FOMMEDRAFT_155211 [Fomitiporia mediterranea MF3/22]
MSSLSSSSRPDDILWTDFDNLRHSVKSYTVDRLKQIITGINEENKVNLSKSGKKQDLIDKITGELDRYRYLRQTELWTNAKTVLYQVKNSGTYASSGPTQSFSANHNFTFNNAHGSAFTPPRAQSGGFHNMASASSSSIGRYDPYAPPRRPLPGQTTSSPVKSGFGTSASIRFKSSPFFKTEQPVSNVIECPESSSNVDRRTQNLNFTLTQEHINKLTSPGSKYQLRLYCTTNSFYSSSPSGFRSNTTLCPIEFPATCEVRVNNTPLQANLKGIKKKPGTAPPADLSKVVRMVVGQPNRVEMIYVNSQPNSPPKKFYLVVFLVEVSTVDELVDRLRKGKFRSSEEIKAQMAKSAVEDDDIVVGKQKMTLKCPLSYTRIIIPCRSSKCVHPQCFDAVSWYSVMEQTTTWLCPVCEKTLNPEELIVDGYFGSILEQTPDSVEEVEVEADGEWHTIDNKIGSKGWMQTHRSKPADRSASTSGANASNQPRSSTSVPPRIGAPNTDAVAQSLEDVVVLDSDSDNEDERRVKRELSPTTSPISMDTNKNGFGPATTKAASSTVIDLTLDSEDEDAPQTAPVAAIKRKASDTLERAEDAIYKKSRLSATPMPAAGGERIHNGYSNRDSSVSSGPDAHPQSPYSRITLPLPRQVSGSANNHHHHSPPIATSPPAYYPPPPQIPTPNARQFVPYTPSYHSQPPSMNGSSVPYNGAAPDTGRQGAPSYYPYVPRSTGPGGPRWT